MPPDAFRQPLRFAAIAPAPIFHISRLLSLIRFLAATDDFFAFDAGYLLMLPPLFRHADALLPLSAFADITPLPCCRALILIRR